MNINLTSVSIKTAAEQFIAESLVRIHQHPFIVEANSHKLTEDQAKRWIMCAGRESRSFPDLLENLISWCKNEQIKNILMQNLADEKGNGVPPAFLTKIMSTKPRNLTECGF